MSELSDTINRNQGRTIERLEARIAELEEVKGELVSIIDKQSDRIAELEAEAIRYRNALRRIQIIKRSLEDIASEALEGESDE